MERTPWQDDRIGGIGFLRAGLISAGAVGALVLVGVLWVSANDAREKEIRAASRMAPTIAQTSFETRTQVPTKPIAKRVNQVTAGTTGPINAVQADANTAPFTKAAVAHETQGPAQGPAQALAQVAAPVTYSQAEAAFLARDFTEAENLFARYVDAHPENAWGHYMHGLSLWKNGRYEEARGALGESIALDSTHFKSYTNLARVLLDEGRAKDALVPARRAIELLPESSTGYRLFGRAAHSMGLADEAADAYDLAIRRNRDDAWALNNLGLLFIEREDFEAAVPPLARAAWLAPHVVTFRNNLGVALERTGQLTLAAEQFESVLLLNESHEKAGISLSRVERLLDENHPETEIDLAEIAAAYGLEQETAGTPDQAIAQSSPE